MTRFSLSLVVALMLGACAVGPDYKRPGPPASKAIDAGAFQRVPDTGADAEVPLARWWEALDDPELNHLVERGLAEAPGIAAAEARARQARAGLTRARAALAPQVAASAAYIYADLPEDAFGTDTSENELFLEGFDARWELDLWGGARRGAEKARAQAQAADAQLADAQVQLSAEIARTYVELRNREVALALLEQRLALESRLADLMQLRFNAGAIAKQELVSTRARSDRTAGQRDWMIADRAALLDSLAVLTGSAPGSLDGLAQGPIPVPPAQVSVGDPATMLARRPDIRSAERKLAAASAQIGVEKARYFPSISLIGLIGIGGTSASDMFDTSQVSSIAVPQLRWNFLDFGRTAGAVRGAKAGRDAALAEYHASVLAALQDAEASLAHFGAARSSYRHSQSAAGHASETARLEDLRSKAGAIASGEAMEAEIGSLDARISMAGRKAGLALSYIRLSKALGLGWQAGAGPE